MKKKVFFVVGLVASAIAASFFIPLQEGEYWWSANAHLPEVVILDGDRIPAGGPQDSSTYYPPQDETTYEEPPVQEDTPTFSGGKDAPNTPVYETPAPSVPTGQMSCIQAAFTDPALRPQGPKYSSNNWVRNVRMSDDYINMYINAAHARHGKGRNSLRAAITSLMAAGYCPGSRNNNYQSRLSLNTKDVIPVVHGKTFDANIRERGQAWRINPNTRPYRCGKDYFEKSRQKICEVIYFNCGFRQHASRECYSRDPRGDGNDKPDTTGGSTTGGSTTGEKEVGEGSNEGSGHGANTDGGHGDGPPGASR